MPASREPARKIGAPEGVIGNTFDALDGLDDRGGPALRLETVTPPTRAVQPMVGGGPPIRGGAGFSRSYSRRLSEKFSRGDLGLGTPLKLFGAAVALMATDYIYASVTGEVLRVMRALAEEGRTMLVVTHEMSFARDVSTRVMFLHQGLVEAEGPPQELFSGSTSDRFRQFISKERA